jgi:hypothetical protein|tara:strand:+ start:2576 stop:2782 length:207 start_codon:yes stop_codon:yes gene_type:complete
MSSSVWEELNSLKQYIQIIEAELSRRRLTEREYAHLQKIIRKNVPPYSPRPTTYTGKTIYKELQELRS